MITVKFFTDQKPFTGNDKNVISYQETPCFYFVEGKKAANIYNISGSHSIRILLKYGAEAEKAFNMHVIENGGLNGFFDLTLFQDTEAK
jgi:hypothetical protein